MNNNLTGILDLLRSVGIILALAFYVAIVIWAYKDARKRTDDPILVATFTAVSMLPVFGVLIYMLVRPSEYLADVRERELEIRMMERELGRQERCPYCKSHIDGDYLSCPVCTTKLRQSCTGCTRPLDPRWVMCPYCETEVPGRRGDRPSPKGGGESARPGARPERSAAPERSAGPSERPGSSRGERPARDRDRTSRSAPSSRREGPAERDRRGTSEATGSIRTEPLAPGSSKGTSGDTTLI